jgi:outer membrane protein assembly factor BamB
VILLLPTTARADDADKKYPLDPQLKILAEDVKSPSYRELILKKMLITDLAAEWQRVETADNPESFLKKHGGKDKVEADPDLKRAYERRVQIRSDFLDLMREGYRRYKQTPPFDKGARAEEAGTAVKDGGGARVRLAPVPPADAAAGQWPRFRGPSGQGLTGLKSLPTKWDKDGTNVAWRVKVPGRSHSSPIAWGNRIFLTTASTDGKERALLCYAAADGKLLWERKAPDAKPETGLWPKNTYATATPVTDGERVVAFLGSCGLVCWDLDGRPLWQSGEFQVKTMHGPGSSPLLWKDLVIFVHDQTAADSIFLALDKKSGKKVWQQPRPRSAGWSTPVVVRVGDHDELIQASAEAVRGYDPASGKELWVLKGPTVEVVPTVVIGKDLIYSASGRNGPFLGLRPGGRGDVTETHLVWRAVRGGPHVPTPLYLNGRLYTVNDTGIATCLDAETGKVIWYDRIRDTFSASPVEAGGLLYFPAESGVTYVLRAGDKFEVVAKNDLGSPILASPAVVGGRLILRTQEELVCVGAKK